MKLRLLNCSIAAAVALIALFAYAGAPAAAAPSRALQSALSSVDQLSDTQFASVVIWARNGANWVGLPQNPAERAERQIGDLGSDDRNAVLAWLRGKGRSALYNRGATDAQIGSRRPGVIPASTPTPNPYRLLDFTTPTLGNRASASGIAVTGGFAAVKRDGKAVVVCVSFKNETQKVASRVDFAFEVYGARGHELETLRLERRGEFSPGLDIHGWQSLGDWQSGIGHRGYGDNCTVVSQNIAANSLLRAQSVTYAIAGVQYADGSAWSNPRSGEPR
jgi:hypothetical protein